MSAESTDAVIRSLRSALGLEGTGPPDRELLGRFVASGDPLAFEALVRRHGALVMGVCRRIVRPGADADDAFQATFLVLARKAAGIRKRDSVGSWLHGVAGHVSRQLVSKTARRLRHERPLLTGEETSSMNADPARQASLRELGALLDEELERLPSDCRAALVACHLEGQSLAAAAQQLGVPSSTLQSRLARGRELLRKRLERRGIGISAVALSIFLGEQSRVRASATLVDATVKSALSFAATGAASVSAQVAALAANALKSMALAKAMTGLLAVALVGMIGVFGAAMALPQAENPQSPKVDGPAVIEIAAAQPRTDRHGDPLPDGAVARLGTTRWRHDCIVGYAAFRPDGKSVVSVGDDMTIRVWEYPSGKEIRRIDLAEGWQRSADFRSSYFSAAALSPDGKTIATNMNWTETRLHDVDTGMELPGLKTTEGWVRAIAFSANSERIAVFAEPGEVFVWHRADGKLLKSFKSTGKEYISPRTMAYSPDGKHVAFFESVRPQQPLKRNDGLTLWNAETGESVGLVDHGDTVNRLSTVFSPDSRSLAFMTRSGTLVLVDSATGKEKQTIAGKDYFIENLVFNKDGTRIYGRLVERKLMIEWDLVRGVKVREFGIADSERTPPMQGGRLSTMFDSMSLSPDERTLALAGVEDRPVFIDVARGKEIGVTAGHSTPILSVQFLPDGQTMWTRDLAGSMRHWSVADGRDRGPLDFPNPPRRVLNSPDGKTVAILARGKGGSWWRLIDVASGQEIADIKPNLRELYFPLAFSSDSKILGVHSPSSPTMELFEVPSVKRLITLNAEAQFPKAGPFDNRDPQPVLLSMYFSHDGKQLASFADTRALDVWDVPTGTRRGTLTLPKRVPDKKSAMPREESCPVISGAFSPDGRCLALEFDDNTVSIFELATGQKRARYGRTREDRPKKIERKFGGAELGGGGAAVVPQSGPSLAFSPNGKLLAHAGQDDIVVLWDVSAGLELAALRGHTGPVTAVAFAPDGKSVASGSWDTTSLVWDVCKWVRPPARVKQLEPGELASNWELLVGDDAAKAYNAIIALSGSPNEAVAFLEQRIKPVTPVEPRRIERLIGQLDRAEFKERDDANSELLKIGEVAVPALDKALAANPTLETRRRLEALRNQSDPKSMILKGDRLRAYRAVEVLERIGTPEARRLLTSYASGAPGALLTSSAAAALGR